MGQPITVKPLQITETVNKLASLAGETESIIAEITAVVNALRASESIQGMSADNVTLLFDNSLKKTQDIPLELRNSSKTLDAALQAFLEVDRSQIYNA